MKNVCITILLISFLSIPCYAQDTGDKEIDSILEEIFNSPDMIEDHGVPGSSEEEYLPKAIAEDSIDSAKESKIQERATNIDTDNQAKSEQDGEYRIHEGDVIEITVYQEPDLTKSVRVEDSGIISFPLIGEVSIGGLTPKEAEKLISEKLEKDFLVNPQVSVFIKEYGTISMLGEVMKPGAYEIKGGVNIQAALAMAGGLRENADPSSLELIRQINGKKYKIRVDLSKSEEVSRLYLKPEDLIIVNEYGKISVLGEVARPGQFYLKENLTVVDAIAMAGGFTDVASGNRTKVIRRKDGVESVIIVPVISILRGSDRDKNIKLQPGDTIVVPESFF